MTAVLAVTLGDLAAFLSRVSQERRKEASDERGK
jgi:hypothetical protein